MCIRDSTGSPRSSTGSTPKQGKGQTSTKKGAKAVCRNFVKGDCKAGAKCRFLHLGAAAAAELKEEEKRVSNKRAQASATTAVLLNDFDEPSRVDGDYNAL